MMTPNQLRLTTLLIEKIQEQAVALRLLTDSTTKEDLDVALGYLDYYYSVAVDNAKAIAPYKATR